MLDTEVAWAAGIIDGEGCITITRQKPGTYGRVNPSHRLFLKVTMGHEPTVRRLLAIFGVGSVHLQESTKGHNDAWSWWVVQQHYRHLEDYDGPHPLGAVPMDGDKDHCAVCGMRITRVKAYVKGPEGLPLKVVPETVYRVTR